MEGAESPIPVIDFDQLGLHRNSYSINGDSLKNVGGLVKNAFSEVGFCYLKNHGFDQCLLDKYFDVSRRFFEQPMEEKMKHVRRNEVDFGWIAVEREHLNPERPGDLKEAFNYHPENAPDDWTAVDFQEASKEMFFRCADLSYRVLDALSVGLGLGDNFMRDAHKYIGKKKTQRHYEAYIIRQFGRIRTSNQGRFDSENIPDYGTLTLVFQDDVGGLEVEIPGKGFVPVTPIPGTVVVNIGDLMQRWTADALVATKHRVLIPETELKRRKQRQSAVFFTDPYSNYVIACLDGSKKYDPVSCIDYLTDRLNSILY